MFAMTQTCLERSRSVATFMPRFRERVGWCRHSALTPNDHLEQQHGDGQHDDGATDPQRHMPPPATERAAPAAVAGKTDRPGFGAGLGQHTAVAADRRMAARTGADRQRAAADAARIAAAVVPKLQLSGHAAIVSRPGAR